VEERQHVKSLIPFESIPIRTVLLYNHANHRVEFPNYSRVEERRQLKSLIPFESIPTRMVLLYNHAHHRVGFPKLQSCGRETTSLQRPAEYYVLGSATLLKEENFTVRKAEK
jgi:hypothetical protein